MAFFYSFSLYDINVTFLLALCRDAFSKLDASSLDGLTS